MDALKFLLGLALFAIVAPRGALGKRPMFKIAYGHDWGAQEYFSKEGYITGFNLQLIAEVCEAAQIDCRTVWDKYTNCWYSKPGEHSQGGKGLMGGWYDACTGWAQTVPRIHVYDFTEAFLYNIPSHFYGKLGASTSNITDISGKKIGFLDGWFSDEKCVARYPNLKGNVMKKENVVLKDTPINLVKALNDNEVELIFASDDSMAVVKDVVKLLDPAIQCAIGGNSMMTRKGSQFTKHWNNGFRKLRANGRFGKLCREQTALHKDQGKIHCVAA